MALLRPTYRESLYAGMERAGYHDGISYDARVWPERGGRMIIKEPGGPPRIGTPADFFTLTGDAKLVRNSVGLLVSSPANGAAVEFDFVGNLLGWILEPKPKTNALFFSDDWGNAGGWGLFAASVTPNAIAAPYAGFPVIAGKMIELVGGGGALEHRNRQTRATTAGATVVMSCLAKQAERTIIQLRALDAGSVGDIGVAQFNLATGTIGTGGAQGAGTLFQHWMEPFAAGWWRCFMRIKPNATMVSCIADYFLCDGSGTAVYVGDGTSGLYVIGAMLEEGPVGTSLIITPAAATVTRAIDRAFRNIGVELDRLKGTMVARFRLGIGNKGANQFVIYVSDNSYNNSATLFSSSGGNPQQSINSNTGFAGLSFGAGVLGDRTLIKQAGAWQLDDVQVVQDGTLGTPDATAPVPLALSRIDLGTDQAGAAANSCESLWLQSFDIYPERKPNAFMQVANLR